MPGPLRAQIVACIPHCAILLKYYAVASKLYTIIVHIFTLLGCLSRGNTVVVSENVANTDYIFMVFFTGGCLTTYSGT